MSDPVEMRALMALYRNHPDTPLSNRWGDKAKRAARGQREMLLAWAATQPDYRLLDCRNLGISSLSWIRAHQPSSRTKHVHDGEWCAACVEHGVAEAVRYDYAELVEAHPFTMTMFDALQEVLAAHIFEVEFKDGRERYLCRMCDADVTTSEHHADGCEYLLLRRWTLDVARELKEASDD